ncbi:MAG TPA: beta-ketoacyl-ACP synthase II, partial [Chloroflexota bacterium]|nr:beta-ketoacyl-ACP synthase II [Chloroflexota bacterium]
MVTGYGAMTGVGLTADESWTNLLAGKSGVARITQFDASSYPSTMASEVKGFQTPTFLDPKEARRMSRFELFALATAKEAIERAGLIVDDSNRDEIGVLLGSGGGSLTTTEHEARTLIDRGGMRMSPFILPMMLANMGTAQVTRVFGLRGYSSTVVTACASGAQAIGEAAEVIRRGAADIMLAGGSEASICELGLASFCLIRALSQRNDDPAGACRPFERDRDGMVPAEGSAILVLESLDSARARKAVIYAEYLGYGVSSDAYHVVAPRPDGTGAARAMIRALKDARRRPDQVDYVNAHGTGTQLGDAAETLALKNVLGDHAYKVPISSTKSMIGHSMGAAGAIEALVSVLSIRDNVVHPTINYDNPDPD